MWLYKRQILIFEKVFKKAPDIDSAWWIRAKENEGLQQVIWEDWRVNPDKAYERIKPFILPHYEKYRLSISSYYSYSPVNILTNKQLRLLPPDYKRWRIMQIRFRPKHQIWEKFGEVLVHIKSPREETLLNQVITNFLSDPNYYSQPRTQLPGVVSAYYDGYIETMLSWFSLKYMNEECGFIIE